KNQSEQIPGELSDSPRESSSSPSSPVPDRKSSNRSLRSPHLWSACIPRRITLFHGSADTISIAGRDKHSSARPNWCSCDIPSSFLPARNGRAPEGPIRRIPPALKLG